MYAYVYIDIDIDIDVDIDVDMQPEGAHKSRGGAICLDDCCVSLQSPGSISKHGRTWIH